MSQKQEKLKMLEAEMRKNKKLPLKSNLVFGEGSVKAKIVFIGEAPGAKEDELGRPFVGRSGKLLEESLEEIGLKREEVYITNIVKRRPPENRDPSLKEIEAYRPYLEKQLEIIKPKIIVSLGRFALNYFFPDLKISEAQGRIFDYELGSENKFKVKLLPIFHPAAAFRKKETLKEFKKSFKLLVAS
ncbi:uracil-DNA glycosylase [Patescibacteria group bacterium]|nr:uracil-DNA glycosylase [Patescibacteria group bacterium]